MNILFCSVGRRVELLKIFREVIQSRTLDGRIIAIDASPLAPALQFADVGLVVPRNHEAAFIPRLLEIVRDYDVDMIFPLIDHDVPVLAQNRGDLEEAGAQVMVVETDKVEVVQDKWVTTNFFRSIGLTTPESWLSVNDVTMNAQMPLLIKPRSGSSSVGVHKVNDMDELVFYARRTPHPIVQRFIDGYEVTTDVACSRSGAILGIVSRRRIATRAGEVSIGVTYADPKIHAACALVAKSLPALGPITIQCIVAHGQPYFTEINARFGGGLPLGVAAGINLPDLIVQDALGRRLSSTPVTEYSEGITMSRFDDSVFLVEGRDGRHSWRRV